MGSRNVRLGLALFGAMALGLMAMASVAAAKDRNHDRIPDRWETKHHLSLKVDQARKDQDSDQLRNRGEFRAGTNPHKADSDGDGIEDGDEGAGTISAWDPDTGELTIDLFGGKQVTGTVTNQTQIECESDDAVEPDDPADDDLPAAAKRDNGGGDDPAGDDEGDGDNNDNDGPNGDNDDCDGNDCSAADLAVGGVVREASAKVTADGLVFEEIELG